jgi:hypothetical protein
MKETIRVSNINGLMVPLLVQTHQYANNKVQIFLSVNESFLK